MKRKIYQQIVSLLASKKFFYALVGLFVLQAAWVAISGRFPMAFDEEFHFGIIKLYAHQWSPFFAKQPVGADSYGAIVRDPSYLYHYLMSFPYRISNGIFHNDFISILVLRFFSIGFMTAALLIFRRLLSYTKASPALIHTVFLFFILTPLVPIESAQMNYDNMLIPLAGLCLLGSVRFVTDLKRTGHLNAALLLGVLSVDMLSTLVKYAFLPVFMVLLVYLLGSIALSYKGKKHVLHGVWKNITEDLRAYATTTKIAVIVIFVGSLALFLQMYGYNTLKYHTPVPECDQVLSVDRCHAYGPWERNYVFAQQKSSVDGNAFLFTKHWAGTYFYSFFSEVNGKYSGFILALALPIIYWTALVVTWLGTVLVIIFARKLFTNHVMYLFGACIGALVVALWLQNYSDYLHLGQHVAEQGRYLLVLLLPIYCIGALAFRELLRKRAALKLGLLSVVFLLFLQGGGILTYIVRTDASWWWENNSFIIDLNQAAQKAIRPFIVEG